jgi:hypothetical protein
MAQKREGVRTMSVRLVYLVYLVHRPDERKEPNKPKKRNEPEEPNEPDEQECPRQLWVAYNNGFELVSRPGLEPGTLALKAQSNLN